mmetsp:Transcript_19851/g.17547  ORF Transcript_19851/g.17547 Transcript_19851/m.17547 type:complete len:91 (-) Transcript_19851:18-290(-)
MFIVLQCIIDYKEKCSKIPKEYKKFSHNAINLLLNYSKKKLDVLKKSIELTQIVLYFLMSPSTISILTKGSDDEKLVQQYKFQLKKMKAF